MTEDSDSRPRVSFAEPNEEASKNKKKNDKKRGATEDGNSNIVKKGKK